MFGFNIKQIEEYAKNELLHLCSVNEEFKKQFEHEVKDIDQYIRDMLKDMYQELQVRFDPEIEKERQELKKKIDEQKAQRKAITKCMKKPENIELVSDFKKNVLALSTDIKTVDIILNRFTYGVNVDRLDEYDSDADSDLE
jgi:DNA-binding transcriptional MerR regulator